MGRESDIEPGGQRDEDRALNGGNEGERERQGERKRESNQKKYVSEMKSNGREID